MFWGILLLFLSGIIVEPRGTYIHASSFHKRTNTHASSSHKGTTEASSSLSGTTGSFDTNTTSTSGDTNTNTTGESMNTTNSSGDKNSTTTYEITSGIGITTSETTTDISTSSTTSETSIDSSTTTGHDNSTTIISGPFQNFSNNSSDSFVIGVSVGGSLFILFSLGILLFILKIRKKKVKDNNMKFENTESESHLSILMEKVSRSIQGEVTIQKKLGSGNFGEVWLGKWQEASVALKKISHKDSEEIQKEVEVLISLNHPNIVRFFGTYTKEGIDYIVMEYFSKGSVLDLIQRIGNDLSLQSRGEIILSTVKGMAYLESKGILHLDLACRNILITQVDEKYESKVSDFGMSRKITDKVDITNWQVAIRWAAPEILMREQVSQKSDVFSFGIVIWEIFSNGITPYFQIQANQQVAEYVISGKRPEKPDDCPNNIFQLMSKSWKQNPEERPTFKQILEILEKEFQQIEIEIDQDSTPDENQYVLTVSTNTQAEQSTMYDDVI